MFADAYELASAFTLPVIISARYFDGSVESGLASMTVLNRDGWAATAAHVFDLQTLFVQQQPEVAEYQRQRTQIVPFDDQMQSHHCNQPGSHDHKVGDKVRHIILLIEKALQN